MKEIIKEVLTGDVNEMISLLKELEISWQDFSETWDLSDEDTNLKNFCENTGRDFDKVGNQDIEAYSQASLLCVAYKKGLQDGKGN